MRILLAQDSDWVMRNPVQQHHLAERMISRGHEVRVIDYDILWKDRSRKELLSKREIFHVSKVLEGVNVTVIRPSILRIRYIEYLSMLFTYSREIKRQMDEFNPDIVIGNSILSNFMLMRRAQRKGIPFVILLVDAEHTLIPSKWLRPTGKMIEGRLLRKANLVIVINEPLREYAIAMGAARPRTMVIRAGIDPKRYNPEVDGNNIRSEYGIDQRDKVLFFMGWLYHFSGLKELARQLCKVKNPRMKLFIVGEGDAYKDLQGIVEQYGLRDRVILAGRQPYSDIPGFIASADICLLPAYNNATMRDIVPIKMYEYLAMGKPVISTDLPGIRQEFGENHGVIYVSGPSEVLNKALNMFEDGSVESEGRKGREFMKGKDWDKVVREFEDLLSLAIRTRRKK